jgi:hypothetical protein
MSLRTPNSPSSWASILDNPPGPGHSRPSIVPDILEHKPMTVV